MGFPVFASGDVLLAADMNAVAGWLVKKVTVGTAVASIPVTNCFSSDYDNYVVTVNGGSHTSTIGFTLTLGSTTTGYYYAANWVTYAGAAGVFNGANVAGVLDSVTGASAGLNGRIMFFNPNLADETSYLYEAAGLATSNANIRWAGGGYLNDATQYTGFTLTPTSGTTTGGTIRVYGLRN